MVYGNAVYTNEVKNKLIVFLIISEGDLREDTRHEKWDLLCVVCCQPYRRSEDEQFGLTFLTVQEATEQSPGLSSMEKMRECAQRSR